MSTADHWMYNRTRGLYQPEETFAGEVGDLFYNPNNSQSKFWVYAFHESAGYMKWKHASEDEAKLMKTHLLLEGVSITD